jgi:very-short-patch-repair endonuclease
MLPEKRRRIHPGIRQRSRELRQPLTPAEQKLWSILRNRYLGGYKFRRQHPVGPFILDFFCAEVRLAIEVDGGVHACQEAYDNDRTAWLEAQGLTVIRFRNDEVNQELNQVAGEILRVCARLKGGEEHDGEDRH